MNIYTKRTTSLRHVGIGIGRSMSKRSADGLQSVYHIFFIVISIQWKYYKNTVDE